MDVSTIAIIIGGIILALIFWGFCLAFFPRYRVWSYRKQGEADLEQAKYEQQILVAKAQARLDAAAMNKAASIVEAEAVSKSIEIIGTTLSHNEGYLRWQWIKMMHENTGSTIYVPTEANLPILEATRKKL